MPAMLICGAVQRQHALQHLGEIDLDRGLRLAVEGQQLAGDLGDARQFLAGQVEIMVGFGVRVGFVPQQKNQVRDGIERIADFVGDGRSQSSRLGQTIAGAQRLLGLAALGHVAKDQDDSHQFARDRS